MPPLIHDKDAVGHGQGFFLIVGDKDRGQAQSLLDVADLLPQRFADAGVQRRQGFVQQQDARLHHQRARQCHALTLTAGQFVRVVLFLAAQCHQADHVGYLARNLAARQLLQLQAEGNVLFHAHVGEQRIALEHHADAAFLRRGAGDVLAVDANTARVDVGQPGQAAQQRGFAAAAGAQQGDEFPFP